MINNIKEFFLANYSWINNISLLYYDLLLLTFWLLIFLNKNEIRKQFKNLNVRDIKIVIFIALIYTALLILIDLPYVENITGWELNIVAKEYSEGVFSVFEDGTFTAYLLSLFFLLFGKSITTIKIFYIFLNFLGVIIVFIATFLLSKNTKASLFSILIYTLSPLSIYYGIITNGRATSAMFAFSLLILGFILSFRIKKELSFLLGLIFLLLAGNTQPDFMIFLIPYTIAYFYFNKEIIRKNFLIIILSIIIFGIFLIYYASHAFLFDEVNSNIALGNLNEIYAHRAYKVNPIIRNLAITSLGYIPPIHTHHGSFSLSYLPINLFIFIDEWFFKNFILFILFLSGLYFMRKSAEIKFFAILFFLYAFIHMVYFYPYDDHFMVVMMPTIAIFGGISIQKFLDFIIIERYTILKITTLLLIILSVLSVSILILNFFIMISKAKNYPFSSWKDNFYLAEDLLKITGKNSTIISKSPVFSIILRFIGAKDAIDFHNLRKMSNAQLELIYSGKLNFTYFKESEEFSFQRHIIKNFVKNNKDLYIFLEGNNCEHTWESYSYETEPGYYICRYILETYNFSKVSTNFSKYGDFILYRRKI